MSNPDYNKIHATATVLAEKDEQDAERASAAKEPSGKPNSDFVRGWLKGSLTNAYSRALRAEAVANCHDALVQALEGAIVVMDAKFEAEGRDPFNNDNYCAAVDALTEARGHAHISPGASQEQR